MYDDDITYVGVCALTGDFAYWCEVEGGDIGLCHEDCQGHHRGKSFYQCLYLETSTENSTERKNLNKSQGTGFQNVYIFWHGPPNPLLFLAA